MFLELPQVVYLGGESTFLLSPPFQAQATLLRYTVVVVDTGTLEFARATQQPMTRLGNATVVEMAVWLHSQHSTRVSECSRRFKKACNNKSESDQYAAPNQSWVSMLTM